MRAAEKRPHSGLFFVRTECVGCVSYARKSHKEKAERKETTYELAREVGRLGLIHRGTWNDKKDMAL
jgi:hypothetical protein